MENIEITKRILWSWENKEGRTITVVRYDKVYNFSEGLAKVEINRGLGFKSYGFIDIEGKEVICPDYYSAGNFSEGLAKVGISYRGGSCGFINKKGELVISHKYDKASRFHKGLASVELDGRKFRINTKGEEVPVN